MQLDQTFRQLSVTGDADTGQTKTFVQVLPNQAPAGSYTVRFSTTYSKAKDPAAHQVKFTLFVADKAALADLALFLVRD